MSTQNINSIPTCNIITLHVDFDVDAYLDESYEKKVKGEKEKTQEKAIPAQSGAAKVDPDKSSDKDKKTGDGETCICPSRGLA